MNAIMHAEPYKLTAGALALLMHGLFFMVLYASISWQMKPPQGMVVEIWESLPDIYEEQQPVQVQPEIKESNTRSKSDLPPIVQAKPDIEIKNQKKIKEIKLQKEMAAEQKIAEKKAEQAERRLNELERHAQERALENRKVQEVISASARKVIDDYRDKIKAKVKRFVKLPSGVDMKIKAEFQVTLLPGGEVLNVIRIKSSGDEAYDIAVEKAIIRAQPLPLPPTEKNLFNEFRDLKIKFSPADGGQ